MLKFNNPKFTVKDKIELLQRFILINSYLYYELGLTIISDHRFDDECRQLCSLKLEHPEEYKNARYSYAMMDFDGSTGFDLMGKLNENDYKSITWHAGIMMEQFYTE